MNPNIFDYATKELTQDALICWLVQWADYRCSDRDPRMHQVGLSFIRSLLKKGGYQGELADSLSISVKRQESNIDVLVVINNKILILIEDKTSTREHSEQLVRYSDYVKRKEEYKRLELIKIYFKTDAQINMQHVIQSGYAPYRLADLMMVLDQAVDLGVENDVLLYSHQYYRLRDQKLNHFYNEKVENWLDNHSYWKGLFQWIDETLSRRFIHSAKVPRDITGYGSGLGMYIGWNVCEEHQIASYLRYVVESRKFVVKLGVIEGNDQKINNELKDLYREKLRQHLEGRGIEVSRANSTGKTATILNVKSKVIVTNQDGMFDEKKTAVQLIKIIDSMQDFKL